MMNDILRDFLHKFVTVYLKDVCVLSRTMEEHMEHLRLVLVLQRFKEEGLKLRLKKCFFGHSANGVHGLHNVCWKNIRFNGER
jgi:hypothetical protein